MATHANEDGHSVLEALGVDFENVRSARLCMAAGRVLTIEVEYIMTQDQLDELVTEMQRWQLTPIEEPEGDPST